VSPILLLAAAAALTSLTVDRQENWLILKSPDLPGGEIRINYLEAYCRANSHSTDWVSHTVVKHKSTVVEKTPKRIRLRDLVSDGVTVDHTISARADGVEFRLVAKNATAKDSEAHWAQPCIRLGAFTGFDADHRKGNIDDYLGKCFVFLDGKLSTMPTRDWVKEARYMPGQVWRAPGILPEDVNPRPLNPNVPSNGLIGCFSGDNKTIFATAWEPYQELFQGIARCIHSDFRLGGLKAGEKKEIRGRIYLVPNDVPALLRQYERDFGRAKK